MAQARAPGPGNAYLFRHGLPITVDEGDFSLGMIRDVPRSTIPTGGAYLMQDMLCDKPGKAYKRGGTVYASPAVNETMINIVAVAEFPGDLSLLMIASNPGGGYHLYDVTKNTAWPGGGVSITCFPYENPTFWIHGGTTGSVIFTHGPGGVTPQRAYLAGTTLTIQDIPGSVPQAKVSCVHLNRLILANSNQYPNRVWFSQQNDPLDWSVANNWVDTENEVTGLASIQGVLLVFHRGSVQRILGDIPPGYGSEAAGDAPNMQIQPVSHNIGCFDARSVVQARGDVWFASEYGIYATNGGAPVSLTTKDDASGIGELWRSATLDLSPGTGTVIAQGVYADTWLLSSVRHPAGMDFQLICHLPTAAFTSTSLNIACVNYVGRAGPHAGIYGCDGNYNEPVRLLDLTPIFTPYPGPQTDADGQPVLPILETRMIGSTPGLKSYFDSHISYDIRGGDMKVEVGTNLEGTDWKVVPESPLRQTTTDAARRRFSVSKDANSIQYRFTQLT